jgi:glycosyltransferase involved in cell wall biosynthesis
LIIGGIIQDENYYREKIEPQLNEQIVYIGHAPPPKRKTLLANALALLHPINFDEPFGLSVAEAMLCGTPVIAINRGAMPELIRHGETGFLVNNVNEAIDAVRLTPEISRQNCYHWAKSKFSAEKMVSDYLRLYYKIIG